MRRALLAILVALPAAPHAADLDCTPRYPVWCANVHISCAGRSTMATTRFEVTMTGETARADKHDWTVAASHSGHVLRRADGTPGYLRLLPDGSFAMRRYALGRAWMSIGTCRSTR